MSADKARKKRRGKRRNGLIDVINGLLSLLVLGLLVAGGLLLFGAQRFYADGPSGDPSIFLVERGTGLSTIAQKLEIDGLVKDRWTFQLGTMAQRKQSEIRAGEYEIAANSSMADVLHEITEGKPITYAVTVPEGFTSWQAIERINSADNMVGEITEIPTEGSLLPNTYNFERGGERQVIVDQMSDAMADILPEIWEARDPDLPLESVEDLVTLASIVEKETGIATERPMVAAVFINRINRGMRLQSDPTIIYGITNGEGPLGRGLTRSEIEQTTAYNTYQIDGLPEGPIANPGRESLEAVAHPAETDALYFVADGTGGHAFADNYADHQQNVANWREIERERLALEAEAAAELEAAEAARSELQAEEADEQVDTAEDEASDDEAGDQPSSDETTTDDASDQEPAAE